MRTHKSLSILALIALVVIGVIMMGSIAISPDDMNIYHVTGNWTYRQGVWSNPGGSEMIGDVFGDSMHVKCPAVPNVGNRLYQFVSIWVDTSVSVLQDSFNIRYWVYICGNQDKTDTLYFHADSMQGKAGADSAAVFVDSLIDLPPYGYLWVEYHNHLQISAPRGPDTTIVSWSIVQPKGIILE